MLTKSLFRLHIIIHYIQQHRNYFGKKKLNILKKKIHVIFCFLQGGWRICFNNINDVIIVEGWRIVMSQMTALKICFCFTKKWRIEKQTHIRKMGFGPGETQVALGNSILPKNIWHPGLLRCLWVSLGVFENHQSSWAALSVSGCLWMSLECLWASLKDTSETSRDTQRHPETSRDTQRHPETSRDIQRHLEIQRHPETPRAAQSAKDSVPHIVTFF